MNERRHRSLVLVRHADSEANAGLATLDPITNSLTEAGQRQARDATGPPAAPKLFRAAVWRPIDRENP